MSIWIGLARALHEAGEQGQNAEDCTQQMAGQLANDLADYLVSDTLARCVEGCRVVPRTVLLCESPHRDEVALHHRHPLAGPTGFNVTNKLLANGNFDFPGYPVSPIGCLVVKRRSRVLDSLGLMNASKLPLQSKVYSPSLQTEYRTLFCSFEKLRGHPSMSSDHAPVSKAIRNSLRTRLIELMGSRGDIEVVPCGKVARKYLRWSKENCSSLNALQTYGAKVSHPNRWNKPRTEDELRAIKELVAHILDRASSN